MENVMFITKPLILSGSKGYIRVFYLIIIGAWGNVVVKALRY